MPECHWFESNRSHSSKNAETTKVSAVFVFGGKVSSPDSGGNATPSDAAVQKKRNESRKSAGHEEYGMCGVPARTGITPKATGIAGRGLSPGQEGEDSTAANRQYDPAAHRQIC